ncbi:hypothetical protein CTAYLR_003571 [Chrysophaeum taylorii]|uniref:DSBA-like thioredoxin domain-containing protein n=1 Tax=Chrysophaeum taylorii TaxID=2483200 RepID=A0AAD7XQI6_9STRA|nr:hypothetical protein CTAYLR_003571 [Chrysophaeum taylorii]
MKNLALGSWTGPARPTRLALEADWTTYIGKKNVWLGLDSFHAAHPDVGVELNVVRHPYSFNADSKTPYGSRYPVGKDTPEGKEPTWHESLLDYSGGSAAQREFTEKSMYDLGRRVGITLDYNVQTNWQPVDSQRAMLWAARFGKQELFMDALGRRHFEQRESASHRATVLAAAKEAGLDEADLAAFLDTDELEKEVWASYASTIYDKGIHAIPYFIFGLPDHKSPFRPNGISEPVVVRGSGDPETFRGVFETLWTRHQAAAAAAAGEAK